MNVSLDSTIGLKPLKSNLITTSPESEIEKISSLIEQLTIKKNKLAAKQQQNASNIEQFKLDKEKVISSIKEVFEKL